MPQLLDPVAIEGHSGTVTTDVAIIGAGPVGLMIANYLGLQGVRVVLISAGQAVLRRNAFQADAAL